MGLLKLLMESILELFFDSKEEYTFTSTKFNLKRVAVFGLFMVSNFFNVFLSFSFYKLGHKYLDLNQKFIEAKNNSKASSDSQNPTKK